MTQTTRQIGYDASDKPHAWDPSAQPQFFEGVLGRRMVAFLIDVAIIFTLSVIAFIVLLVAGILTFGLTWLLLGVTFPAVALGYNAWTLSRAESATIGMRMVGLEMRTWYGGRMYALLAAFHALLFYFSVTFLTPFVLLIALFNERKRCLHDFFAGTVIINNEDRARTLGRT
ncbi:MAG: RDD family protein [Pseudomonadota bacterium]|nr:RDD family protein [Pseudomonadota bacterium]